jgi:FkbM family methyltransferase
VLWPKKKRGWLLVTPPVFKKQILYSRELRRSLRIQIGSFYDWSTIYQIFINLEYDSSSFVGHRGILENHLNDKDDGVQSLILDLGANIGVSAAYFSITYPEAKVVSVEAATSNLSLLKKNSSIYENTSVIHSAVGPDDGTVLVYDPGIGNNAFRTFGSEEEALESVNEISINTLISLNSELDPFIVKLDIEGSEKQLFSRNTEWVDKFKVVIVEIHDWMLPGQAISANLMKVLGGKNRDLLFRGENLFSIRNV